MKFIISTILIAALAFGLSFFMPWWGFAIGAFIIGGIFKIKSGSSFLSGFLAIALLFGIYATMLNSANDGLLASKVAQMFSMPNAISMVILTAIIGGLVGGLAAWSGNLGRKMIG